MEVLSAAARQNPQVQELARHIQAAVEATRAPEPTELLARVAANPADLPARLELAEYWINYKEWEPALEQLLAIVERDRAFGDDIGRKKMIEVFELASTQPQLVSQWRRRLGSALNVR
jgi:putative thioredoxin